VKLRKRDAIRVVVLIIIVHVGLNVDGGSVLAASSASSLVVVGGNNTIAFAGVSSIVDPKGVYSHHLRHNRLRRQE
jgi:flagellar motor component MotA